MTINPRIGMALRTVYPCCKTPARLTSLYDVPRELYERTCPHCGTRWTVERRTTRKTANGLWINVVEWERVVR